MQGSLDQPPIVVRSSRWMWMMLISLVYTGGAVELFLPVDQLRGILGIVLFVIMFPFRIVFVALAALLSIFFDLSKPDREFWVAWIMLSLFGCLSLMAARKMVWPETLEIGPSGVRMPGLLRRRSFQWRDIGNFRSYGSRDWTSKVFGEDVVGDYHPEGIEHLGPGRESDAVELAKGAGVKHLGWGWELDAVELAKLLNAARARWTKSMPRSRT